MHFSAEILIVEESQLQATQLQAMLEDCGFHSEALARRLYQLVLMDCQMPQMDGFEATAQIRSNDGRFGTHTIIIALTAHAIKGDRERCLAAGLDDYLTKPIDREVLRTTLEKWSCKPMTTTDIASGNVSQQIPLIHQFDTPPHHFPLAHK
jgi:CheY-like chemotaxis protein